MHGRMTGKGKRLAALLMLVLLLAVFGCTAFASEGEDASLIATQTDEETSAVAAAEQTTQAKAYAAAIIIGLAASAGAIAMTLAIRKSVDGIARQPESSGEIRTSMMLGLVFIETAIIYALIVAILIVFVL